MMSEALNKQDSTYSALGPVNYTEYYRSHAGRIDKPVGTVAIHAARVKDIEQLTPLEDHDRLVSIRPESD